MKSELPGGDCDDEEVKSMVFMMILKMKKDKTPKTPSNSTKLEQNSTQMFSDSDLLQFRPSSSSHRTELNTPKTMVDFFDRQSMNRASERYRKRWVRPKINGEVIVKALYDYEKDEEDELSFLEGDEIIKLNEPSDEGKQFLFLLFLPFIRLVQRTTSEKW